MSNFNYIGSIVKILETPVLNSTNSGISLTKFRVQFPQTCKKQTSSIVTLVIQGYLANDIVKYYQINDYILVEGFISLKKLEASLFSNKSCYVEVNIKKVFPLFLINSFFI